MVLTFTLAHRIRAITTVVSPRVFENTRDTVVFSSQEVDSVVRMVGVKRCHGAEAGVCNRDVCVAVVREVLAGFGWEPESMDGVIMVTQRPESFPTDRSVGWLFGGVASATTFKARSAPVARPRWFSLHTNGEGYRDPIMQSGEFRGRLSSDRRKHFLHMNGACTMNSTMRRVPPHGYPSAEVVTAMGLREEQIERVLRDIIAKPRLADYLHATPVLFEPVSAETGTQQPSAVS